MNDTIKVGIWQPYFMPYIGYFQLINSVDKFVIYDNIEYTKKGWINRNRILMNGTDKQFTINLTKDSDYLDVRDRYISEVYDRKKLLNQITAAYSKAPFYNDAFPIIRECIEYPDNNLFNYIYNSVLKISRHIGIDTDIIVSSTLNIGKEYKGQDKVLAICKSLNATDYTNSIGGKDLYNREEFERLGIRLHFHKTDSDICYKQFKNEFVPSLSIIDVMMFNSLEEIREMLNRYTVL